MASGSSPTSLNPGVIFETGGLTYGLAFGTNSSGTKIVFNYGYYLNYISGEIPVGNLPELNNFVNNSLVIQIGEYNDYAYTRIWINEYEIYNKSDSWSGNHFFAGGDNAAFGMLSPGSVFNYISMDTGDWGLDSNSAKLNVYRSEHFQSGAYGTSPTTYEHFIITDSYTVTDFINDASDDTVTSGGGGSWTRDTGPWGLSTDVGIGGTGDNFGNYTTTDGGAGDDRMGVDRCWIIYIKNFSYLEPEPEPEPEAEPEPESEFVYPIDDGIVLSNTVTQSLNEGYIFETGGGASGLALGSDGNDLIFAVGNNTAAADVKHNIPATNLPVLRNVPLNSLVMQVGKYNDHLYTRIWLDEIEIFNRSDYYTNNQFANNNWSGFGRPTGTGTIGGVTVLQAYRHEHSGNASGIPDQKWGAPTSETVTIDKYNDGSVIFPDNNNATLQVYYSLINSSNTSGNLDPTTYEHFIITDSYTVTDFINDASGGDISDNNNIWKIGHERRFGEATSKDPILFNEIFKNLSVFTDNAMEQIFSWVFYVKNFGYRKRGVLTPTGGHSGINGVVWASDSSFAVGFDCSGTLIEGNKCVYYPAKWGNTWAGGFGYQGYPQGSAFGDGTEVDNDYNVGGYGEAGWVESTKPEALWGVTNEYITPQYWPTFVPDDDAWMLWKGAATTSIDNISGVSSGLLWCGPQGAVLRYGNATDASFIVYRAKLMDVVQKDAFENWWDRGINHTRASYNNSNTLNHPNRDDNMHGHQRYETTSVSNLDGGWVDAVRGSYQEYAGGWDAGDWWWNLTEVHTGGWGGSTAIGRRLAWGVGPVADGRYPLDLPVDGWMPGDLGGYSTIGMTARSNSVAINTYVHSDRQDIRAAYMGPWGRIDSTAHLYMDSWSKSDVYNIFWSGGESINWSFGGYSNALDEGDFRSLAKGLSQTGGGTSNGDHFCRVFWVR